MGGVCRSWPVILLKTAARLLIQGAQSPGRLAYSRPSMSFQRKPSRDRASPNFCCMLGEVPQSTLRRRFSDPDDSGELAREDGVGVRGPDLGGAPFPAGPSSILTGIASPTGPDLGGELFPAGPSSILTGIASPTGPESPEFFREASGLGPLLPSIASFHTHTQQTSHKLVEISH